MKKSFSERYFFTSFAAGCAIALLAAAFIGGVFIEQALEGMPDRVNFKQCLPWFIIFASGTLYLNSAFDFSRNIYHSAFSIFVSILITNVLMMALPFFEVLYFIQVTTLIYILLLESVCMGAWLLIFYNLWRKLNPPAPTVVFCCDLSRGEAVAGKINSGASTNRIMEVILYGESDFGQVIGKYVSVVLVNPPDNIKNDIAFICWEQRKELIIVPEVYELIVNNATLVQFDDLMAYRTKSMGITIQQRFIKRAFDVIGSFAALILLSPLYLTLSIIVKSDGGSVIYSQKRVTRANKAFNLYKFRTMIPDAEKETGPTLAFKDDPRITKAGRWLRSTRLDELPQFWNVLKGDMSIVGPRPEREHFINLYRETIPEYQYRTNVRAGITGLAHVLGKYNTTPEERIKLDLTYIQNYSFILDMKIMLETIRVVLTKENAEGIEPKVKNEENDETEYIREPALK